MADAVTTPAAGERKHFSEHVAWKTWGAIVTLVSLGGVVLKPLLPWLTPAVFGVSAVVALLACLRGRHRGALLYAVAAAVLAGAWSVGQVLSANRVGPNPGVIGRAVPQVAYAQAAILPMGPARSALLELGTGLRSRNLSTQEASARRALGVPDAEDQRLAIDALLMSGSVPLRALALREIIRSKKGHWVPVAVVAADGSGALPRGLRGAILAMQAVDASGSAFEGTFTRARSNAPIAGTVSLQGVTVATTINLEGPSGLRQCGLSFAFVLTGSGPLTGTASASDGETVAVSLPLL